MNDGDWVEAVREQAAAAQAQVKPINGPSPTKETKFKMKDDTDRKWSARRNAVVELRRLAQVVRAHCLGAQERQQLRRLGRADGQQLLRRLGRADGQKVKGASIPAYSDVIPSSG